MKRLHISCTEKAAFPPDPLGLHPWESKMLTTLKKVFQGGLLKRYYEKQKTLQDPLQNKYNKLRPIFLM